MGTLKKNLLYAFGSQAIQLIRSVIVSLLIPKILGIQEYGFWQLFIFYTQYGGFLHLGLIDGISLREGGNQYTNLNFKLLGVQLRVLLIWICIAILPFCLLGLYNEDQDRSVVILMSCLFVIINLLYTFFLYIMQAVNRIKEASYGKILISIIFIGAIIFLLSCHVNDYRPYIYTYISAHVIGLLYYMFKCKEIINNILSRATKTYIKCLYSDIITGFVLLMSNIMGMLIVGYGRFMIDYTWGITTFSTVSFAFMFVNFFLMFINQASQVLFPELRRRSDDDICFFFEKYRHKLSLMFPIALLLYAPICLFVNLWLPKYSQSMEYLVFLLPLCVFDSQMNSFCNTLYKVFNKTNQLFMCNAISLFVSSFLISVSIYIF